MVTLGSTNGDVRSLVSSQQFDREGLDRLLTAAADFEDVRSAHRAGTTMASLFYEPSTRTRLSFESAMHRLGGDVIGTEAAREFSSVVKGETLEDSIRVICGYADVIVIRHDEMGAAARAASVSACPVINAGDGPGEHPTQALLDLYTILKERGSIDGAHVAFCGDLRFGRTVRSLAPLLALYQGVRMTFCALPSVQIGEDVQQQLRSRDVPFELVERLDPRIGDVDVVYQTRVQRERFERTVDYERAREGLRIDQRFMESLPPRAVIMHPLPRLDEIAAEVDTDPRAAYFRQAHNGVVVRMALLDWVLS